GDVWSFGCVMYEMLTGRRAFGGEDVSDVLAAVIRGEPDWTALPADVPPSARTLIGGCLQKDRRERIADISSVRFLMNRRDGASSPPQGAAASTWKRATRVAAIAAAAGAVGAGVAWRLSTAPGTGATPPTVTRFSIPLGEHESFSNIGRQLLDISPDGTQIVYVA